MRPAPPPEPLLPATSGIQVLEHRVLHPDPAIHDGFPRLVRAADGRLLLFFRRGVSHAADASRILLQTSFDEGRTWTEPREIWRDPSGWCAHNPVAVLAADGSLTLWCSRYDWRHNRRNPCVVARSTNHGESWSLFRQFDPSPYRSTYYVTDAIAVGQRLFAVSATFGPQAKEPCWCEGWWSDDHGVTWREAGPLTRPSANLGDEVGLGAIDEQRLVMLLRGRKRSGLFRYTSHDGGRTWSPEEPLGAMVGTLQRPFLTRLSDGRWLLSGRQAEAAPREVVAYLSTDGLQSFGSKSVLLTYVTDGGYTTVVPLSDERLLLAAYADAVGSLPDLHLFELGLEKQPGSPPIC